MIWRCDLLPQYEAYRQEIDEAVKRVLSSGRYILASEVADFEKEFAEYVGAKYAIGVANATDGLTLSLAAIGISPGDEVITTPFTAIPTMSAIIDSGAVPVFIDVCPDTFLIDLEKIPYAITSKTKAIMPVHIFGNVVDIEKLREIAGEDIAVIEDASQAHGSKIKGTQAGSMGDLGVFSFYPTKNLGGYGDGGIVVTNNRGLADRLKLLRMYGMIDKDRIIMNGVNSRLDEIQAAILRVKLRYLDEMNDNRNKVAERYRNSLKTGLFEHQLIPTGAYSNYHVFVSKIKGDRAKFMDYMDKQNIQTNIYYPMPLYLQKGVEFLGVKKGTLSVVEKLCEEVIALPMYPELDQKVQDLVIETVNRF